MGFFSIATCFKTGETVRFFSPEGKPIDGHK